VQKIAVAGIMNITIAAEKIAGAITIKTSCDEIVDFAKSPHRKINQKQISHLKSLLSTDIIS
jgi:hypothetical protein